MELLFKLKLIYCKLVGEKKKKANTKNPQTKLKNPVL